MITKGLDCDAGGFDESLTGHEDWEFLVRLGLLRPMIVTDRVPAAYYRVRPDSMARNVVGKPRELSKSVVKLHDLIRQRESREWFGVDLLGAEQLAYSRLSWSSPGEKALLNQLTIRMDELERIAGPGPLTGRFGYIARLIGYTRATAIRHFYFKYMLRLRG
jgi:hypothetical protein